jgi:hypothetical protein
MSQALGMELAAAILVGGAVFLVLLAVALSAKGRPLV